MTCRERNEIDRQGDRPIGRERERKKERERKRKRERERERERESTRHTASSISTLSPRAAATAAAAAGVVSTAPDAPSRVCGIMVNGYWSIGINGQSAVCGIIVIKTLPTHRVQYDQISIKQPILVNQH